LIVDVGFPHALELAFHVIHRVTSVTLVLSSALLVR